VRVALGIRDDPACRDHVLPEAGQQFAQRPRAARVQRMQLPVLRNPPTVARLSRQGIPVVHGDQRVVPAEHARRQQPRNARADDDRMI
jgi:hypothetical protein